MTPPTRTGEPFRVSFESPQSGWMSLRLTAGGQSLVDVVSHAPYDSLRELIAALLSLLEGRGPSTARWNCEPEEFDFVFRPEGEEAAFEVVRFVAGRRLDRGDRLPGSVAFATRGPRDAVCRAFWRELRQLRSRASADEFESNWRRPFPDEDLHSLTKALRSRRRDSARPPS